MATVDAAKRPNGHRIECACGFCVSSDRKRAEKAARLLSETAAAEAGPVVAEAGPAGLVVRPDGSRVIADAGCEAGTCAHSECAAKVLIAAAGGAEPGTIGAAVLAAEVKAGAERIRAAEKKAAATGSATRTAAGARSHAKPAGVHCLPNVLGRDTCGHDAAVSETAEGEPTGAELTRMMQARERQAAEAAEAAARAAAAKVAEAAPVRAEAAPAGGRAVASSAAPVVAPVANPGANVSAVAAAVEAVIGSPAAAAPAAAGPVLGGTHVVATVGTRGAWHVLANGAKPGAVSGACGWSGRGMVAIAPNGAEHRAIVCGKCRAIAAGNGWSTAGRNAAMWSPTLAGEGSGDVTIDAGQPAPKAAPVKAEKPAASAAAPAKAAPVKAAPVAPVVAQAAPVAPVGPVLSPAAQAALAEMRARMSGGEGLASAMPAMAAAGEYGQKAIVAAGEVISAEITAAQAKADAERLAAAEKAAREKASVIPAIAVNRGPAGVTLPAGMSPETAALVAQAAGSLAAAAEAMARTGAMLLAALGVTGTDPAAVSPADLAARLRSAGLPAAPAAVDALAASMAPIATRPAAPVMAPVEYVAPVTAQAEAAPVTAEAAPAGDAEAEAAARERGAAYGRERAGNDPVKVAVAVASTQPSKRLANIAATAALSAIGGPDAVKKHWPAYAAAFKSYRATAPAAAPAAAV